jgi:hypothetical protein
VKDITELKNKLKKYIVTTEWKEDKFTALLDDLNTKKASLKLDFKNKLIRHIYNV